MPEVNFSRMTSHSQYFENLLYDKINSDYLGTKVPGTLPKNIADMQVHPAQIQEHAMRAYEATDEIARTVITLMSRAEGNLQVHAAIRPEQKKNYSVQLVLNAVVPLIEGFISVEDAQTLLVESGYPEGFDNYLHINLQHIKQAANDRNKDLDKLKEMYLNNLEQLLKESFGGSVMEKLRKFDKLVGAHLDDRKYLNIYDIKPDKAGVSVTLGIVKTGNDSNFIQGVHHIIRGGFNQYQELTGVDSPAIAIKFLISPDKGLIN